MKKKTVFAIAGIAVSALAVAALIMNKKAESTEMEPNKAESTEIGSNKEESTEMESDKAESTEMESDKAESTEMEPDKAESTEMEPDKAESTEMEPNKEESISDENTHSDFFISNIPDEVFEKMQGKSYKEDCTIDREELRYVHVLHTGFDGEVKEGELVVNRAIAEDILEIFEELFRAKYPIEKVRLVDEYDADDESSMSDNNTSAFNFRFISHTTKISKHGLGMAIDINPLYNPYVKTVDGKLSIEPANSTEYVDRDKETPYKIDHDDLCYKLFTEHGFTWGGDWKSSKDYQHFEKAVE